MTDQALRQFLYAVTAIRLMVGPRIHMNAAPRNAPFPRIVTSRVSGERFNDLAGRGNATDETWQIDCQAVTAEQCASLAAAVELALNGYLGPLGTLPRVAAELVNQADDYDPPTDASDRGVHRAILDFQLLAEE